MGGSFKQRVNEIVRYSSLYYGNSSAIEERSGMEFNIELPEERAILNAMKSKRIILLTGEAGDGKSRMIKNLSKYEEAASYKCIDDFSALDDTNKKHVIIQLLEALKDNNTKLLIAANIGILAKFILSGNYGLSLEMLKENEDCFIVNFEHRNLAQDSDNFKKIAKDFYRKCDFDCYAEDCDLSKQCPYHNNLIELNKDIVIENLRLLCNAIYLMGGHITFRELLSFLSSLATGGYDCDYIKSHPDTDINYYNIFEKTDGAILNKISILDPSKQSARPDEDLILYERTNNDLIKYKAEKRKRYFFSKDETYQKLSGKFLNEYSEILNKINEYPYYFDVTENNEALIKIKEGLVRLISPGKTDLEISFFDMPAPFPERIKTKFLIDFDKLTLIWNHPQWSLFDDRPKDYLETNYFYLSGIYSDKDDKPKCYSLRIDYLLFQYIYKAEENYYFSSSSNVFHEYGLFDFFKTVLSTNSKFAERVEILFDSNQNDISFEMGFYSPSHLIKGNKSKRVKIKTI